MTLKSSIEAKLTSGQFQALPHICTELQILASFSLLLWVLKPAHSAALPFQSPSVATSPLHIFYIFLLSDFFTIQKSNRSILVVSQQLPLHHK